MYRVDLHTHSIASKDGGITPAQYKKVLAEGVLDLIAVTDHNRIDLALSLKKELGEHIIVGEEIMTNSGEIIGLYLQTPIKPGLSTHETIKQIKDQGGLVYIPHPFESIRHGLHPAVMEDLADHIDIVEVCNGRAFFQNRSEQTAVWAKLNQKVGASSSDAHGIRGIGRSYTSVNKLPAKENLVEQIGRGIPIAGRPSTRALLYPKYNRFLKKIGREK